MPSVIGGAEGAISTTTEIGKWNVCRAKASSQGWSDVWISRRVEERYVEAGQKATELTSLGGSQISKRSLPCR